MASRSTGERYPPQGIETSTTSLTGLWETKDKQFALELPEAVSGLNEPAFTIEVA